MHFTVRAIGRLYALEKDLRTAAPVIERLALRGERGDIAGAEALLDEPVRGVRGEREELAQLERLGPLLAGEEQPLAVAGVAIFGRDRQAGEFGALVVGEGVERGAAADRAVVLHHQEIADLRFQQFAAALDQRAVRLE